MWAGQQLHICRFGKQGEGSLGGLTSSAAGLCELLRLVSQQLLV